MDVPAIQAPQYQPASQPVYNAVQIEVNAQLNPPKNEAPAYKNMAGDTFVSKPSKK